MTEEAPSPNELPGTSGALPRGADLCPQCGALPGVSLQFRFRCSQCDYRQPWETGEGPFSGMNKVNFHE